MKIGVMTGGGDTQALNATLNGIVKRAKKYNHQIIGFRYGWKGVLNLDYMNLEGVDPNWGGTVLKTSRKKLVGDELDTAAVNISSLVDSFIAIGGDDTLTVGKQISDKLSIPFCFITKTIDNDNLHSYDTSEIIDRTYTKHTVTAYALGHIPDADNGDYNAAFSTTTTYKSSTEEPNEIQYQTKSLSFPKHFWLSYRLSAATAPRPMTYDAGTEDWYDQLDDILNDDLSIRKTAVEKKTWLINQNDENYTEFIDDFKNRTTSVRYGI